MQMKMTVSFTDETKKQCIAVFADFVAFERTWNRSVAKFSSDLRLTDIAWLCWKSEVRLKNTSQQFDEWLLSVAAVDIDADDEDQPEESAATPDPLV